MVRKDSAPPLVSCIMPTYNRRPFVGHAIEYFLRQDYPNKELIVVDDGADPVGDLIPLNEPVHYIRLDRKHTIGAKRNLACEHSRGPLIAHWDDDDWQAPSRLSTQVKALLDTGKDVCGCNRLLFYDQRTGLAYAYEYPERDRFWLYGNSLLYRREFWQRHRFVDVDIGEDTRFVWSGEADRMVAVNEPCFHVGIVHGGNVTGNQTSARHTRAVPLAAIHELMRDDFARYQPGAMAAHRNTSVALRFDGSLAVARAADLALPEFAALNHKFPLPWMRRWELPYALHTARLEPAMRVLDCTINPAGFGDRLRQLYPHVSYFHWNPIQNGRFELPFGVPDNSYDRVFCINTLEHLLRPQRERLFAAMARKLKDGGLLILTSDYYFDSFWEREDCLRMGLVRRDRSEVFNGWNRVEHSEWIELARAGGLSEARASDLPPAPAETDASLYRNQPPFPHTTIAGAFRKGEAGACNGKKVLLALLTWNTRQPSLEALQAYVREAGMLERLGQQPFLCVVDNGSGDGTPEALRAFEAGLEFPHRFICNAANRGNSVARNQIIETMLDCGADYVLFLDGDIEIVPGSGFAMLRYMEDCGHTLGCIGANSADQTVNRNGTAPFLYSVRDHRVETTNLVAWTQYGMFRREVFEDGVRFDDRPPFDGPGWGFEDNDLAFQMAVKGYRNQYFIGMVYLHRAPGSSIRNLKQDGIDPNVLFSRRKRYLVGKWAGVPEIAGGPLQHIRRIEMRL